MLIAIAQLAGGFIGLVWGADRLVAGGSALARNLECSSDSEFWASPRLKRGYTVDTDPSTGDMP